MTFYDVLAYFKAMPGKDLFALLGELESGILYLASKWHCPAALFYVVGIALALTFGFLAYRWVRASVIAVNAIFGILVGAAAFYALWNVLPRLPAAVCYLFCFIAATIFVCLPIKKPIVALSFYAAIVSYFIMDFYVPSTAVCLGAAFVAAVLTVLIPGSQERIDLRRAVAQQDHVL